jgi:hypothetical protein
MNEPRRVAVIGAGDLGRRVFQELARSTHPRHLRLFGRDEEAIVRAANLARFCALQRGVSPIVSHAVTDLTDLDRTAEGIARFDPDVIFLTASFQAWWVISTLPVEFSARLAAAHFGPWLPMHLAPVALAMRALRQAGCTAVVVNAAYPDAVHPVLAGVGLSPDVGIGNVANNVPGLRVAAAAQLGVEPTEVTVRLVAHHYVAHRLSRSGDSGPAEMDLTVYHDGTNVTGGLDVAALARRLPTTYRRTGGVAGQAMTAASALSVLEPLISQCSALTHAPGPGGRIGGYPIAIEESGRIDLALPEGLSEEAAVKINITGQTQDGIAEILSDGTVRFEPAAMEIMRRELGYECATMPLSEVGDRADEIARRFASCRERVQA